MLSFLLASLVSPKVHTVCSMTILCNVNVAEKNLEGCFLKLKQIETESLFLLHFCSLVLVVKKPKISRGGLVCCK